MPLPKTKNVGRLIRFLKKEKPGMSLKQKRAIALNTARKEGADIPEPKKKKRLRKALASA